MALTFYVKADPAWSAYFDNTVWSANQGSWSGSDWDSSGNSVILDELGTWVEGFRPTNIRITFTGSGGLLSAVQGTDTGFGAYVNTSNVTSGQSLALSFSSNDILDIGMFGSSAFTVTNIEFFV